MKELKKAIVEESKRKKRAKLKAKQLLQKKIQVLESLCSLGTHCTYVFLRKHAHRNTHTRTHTPTGA